MLQLSQFTRVRRGAILLLVPCFLTACNVPVLTAETRDPNRLWCNEHDVYEDDCCICHPELAAVHGHAPAGEQEQKQARDPNRLWCNAHGLYEDECLICHPELGEERRLSTGDAARDPNCLGAPRTACTRTSAHLHPRAGKGDAAPAAGKRGPVLRRARPDGSRMRYLPPGIARLFQPRHTQDPFPVDGVREGLLSGTGYPALADWSGGAMVSGRSRSIRTSSPTSHPLLDGVIKAVHVDAGDGSRPGSCSPKSARPNCHGTQRIREGATSPCTAKWSHGRRSSSIRPSRPARTSK